MKNVLTEDLNKLLRAIGDPFQVTQIPSFREGEPEGIENADPMLIVQILIQFASSDLWRDHLRRSNFDTYEDMMSLENQKKGALWGMLCTTTFRWPKFLCTPARIVATIRRLEELQCLNTAEVVMMWAWTTNVVDPMNYDGWRLVGNDTLRFYRTHGMGRLNALKRHIVNPVVEEEMAMKLLLTRYEGIRSPCRMGRVRRPATTVCRGVPPGFPSVYYTDLRVSHVCQLRRLYHLFGGDVKPWREVVPAEEVDEEIDTSRSLLEVPGPSLESCVI
ncbi:hypothetical protein BJ322DRAFT_540240 [Thelephora terrestris]|uniref:Uncharacterized protein n=1 Tax=Thelephora terrestris TaxID=56493 RepID=A0A9P6HKX9_9AGAM|nr:hypothetical protein BJ322DRAFT_540240 [Thelephora terrestris]